METRKVSGEELVEIVENQPPKIISVEWILRDKKTITKRRGMHSKNVKAGKVGGNAPYDFEEKELIPFVDFGKARKYGINKAHTTIDKNNILSVVAQGTRYERVIT